MSIFEFSTQNLMEMLLNECTFPSSQNYYIYFYPQDNKCYERNDIVSFQDVTSKYIQIFSSVCFDCCIYIESDMSHGIEIYRKLNYIFKASDVTNKIPIQNCKYVSFVL